MKFILTPILPKSGTNFPTKKALEARAKVQAMMNSKTGPEIKRELQKTTSGWRTRVDFAQAPGRGANVSISVFPRGSGRRIWEMVTGGTRPHTITARNAPGLTVQTYLPRTMPGGLLGGPGIRTGLISYPKMVQNPGIAARDFEKDIADSYRNTFQQDINGVFASVYKT